MAPVTVDMFKPFLPPGAKPHGTTSHAKQGSRDKEADPKVKRDRALGQYGFNLLEIIDKDYQKQITVWKDAFADVVAAYATAVGWREKTFADAKEERERDADRDAFIFSLLTGGAMVFLGAWVQYSLVPSVKISRYKWDHSVPSMEKVTVERFSHLQAKMFGGLTEVIGDRVIEHEFPKPKAISYPMDQPSVGHNLTADLNRLVDESSDVVRDQLVKAQKWMNEGTEFGEAWVAYTGGNAESARMQIRLHFDKLRQEWAKNWEFFGKTPNKIVRKFLADQYERALWATYIVEIIQKAISEFPTKSVVQDKLLKMEYTYTRDLQGLESYLKYNSQKLVEAAIVNRLKELNVVLAETTPGKTDQEKRITDGSPRPETHIEGPVDTGHEVEEIYSWAKGFLKSAPGDTAHKFFPPAKPRTLEPL